MEDKLDQLFGQYPPHLTHFKWREGDGEQPEGVFDMTELSQAIQSLINSAVREAENNIRLQPLDPDKHYVAMFKHYPPHLKWEDKPSNVSSILLDENNYTIVELETAMAELKGTIEQ